MNEEVFESVVGRLPVYVCTDAVLDSKAWERRACGCGRVYPALVPRSQSSLNRCDDGVHGKVITDLSDIDMILLDAFEDEYEKEILQVQCQSGEKRSCYVYVYREIESWVTDQPWSYDSFVAEHLEDYLEGCRRFRQEMMEDHPETN